MIKPLGRHALDFFQIWNQKICRGKKEKQTNKLRRRRWQSRGYAKLKQQISNPAQIANHSLHLRLLLLFLLFLLLFLLSMEIVVVSLSIWVGFEFFFSFLCFQWHWFTWLDLEESRALSTRAWHWKQENFWFLKLAKCFNH